MAIALYIVLLRLGVRPWLAALACVPILLDGYQIFIEQFILSETLFEVLAVAAFVVLLWRERISSPTAGIAALLVSLAAITRVVGLVLIPIVLAYIVVRRRGVAAIASGVVAAAVPLLLYASWYNSVNGSFQLTGNTWITLYGRIAPFANCSGLQLPAEERVLCDPRPVGDRPGPNWYLFDSNSPIRKLPPSRGNELLQDFSAKIILHRPWTYSRVVGREFLHYFGYIRRADRWEDPLMVFRIREAGETLPGPPWVMVMANESVDQVYRKALHVLHRVPFPNPQPSAGLNGVWRAYQDVAVTPGPLLALAALLGVLSAFGRRPSRGRSLRAQGILFTVSGLALLLTPVATNVFDYRYLIPALPLLSAGGVIGATALYRRWSTRKAEPAGDAHPPS
jgi:4-amino-4-deoxy-L-arabinose transferase-like glycosyltransferase